MTERSLAALGFAAFDQVASGPLAERAGVIASFILNAHFVPGWPPPRPISALETETLLRRLGATDLKPALTADEVEKLLYLSKLGLLPGQLARLLKAIANRPLRCKILDALAVLLTNMGAALGILREELAALADELSAREAVAVEARPGGSRRRIDLR